MILLRISAFMSLVILACNFLFCDILSGFGIREMVSSQNELKMFLSLQFF